MARPVNADAKKTRERLLCAAAALFSDRGERATTLREVADAADVTMATIHHYFGNKESLYAACLESVRDDFAPFGLMLEEIFGRLEAESFTDDDPGRVLDRLVRGGFRYARNHRSGLQLIMRSVVDTGELDRKWRDRMLIPFLERCSATLAPRLPISAGEVRLHLQSLIALGMRYALSSPPELASFFGAKKPVAAAEDHLVSTARLLLVRNG